MNINLGLEKRIFKNVQFDDLLSDLIKEIELRNYLITRVSHIDNGWKRGTQNFRFRKYKIIEFCNLESCSKMISLDFDMGFFLPSRFLVYQKLDSTNVIVSYQKTTVVAQLFDSPELLEYTTRLEEDIYHVLEEIDF
ncbi:MAG: DUF302 domain-containing protein [Proteobacteria bacterium]|nr:DUF302 domain-containing protein [Pseudomonadota bacterium]